MAPCASMKFLPLIWAALRRKPLGAFLSFASVAIAFLVAGVAMGFAALLPRTGTSNLAVDGIAIIGFVMNLFLTGNAAAHSVRLRIGEFAVLKTLGFPTRIIIALVFAEVAIPCATGAVAGLGIAEAIAVPLLSLLPHNIRLSHSFVPPRLAVASLGIALLLALVSTVIPASRIARLNVATALRSFER